MEWNEAKSAQQRYNQRQRQQSFICMSGDGRILGTPEERGSLAMTTVCEACGLYHTICDHSC
jgi:hypothetical protein